MVKILFDLDTQAAYRLLSDLVDRRILVKTSAASRGPGVTYGPGAKFPKKRAQSQRKAKPAVDSADADRLSLDTTAKDIGK